MEAGYSGTPLYRKLGVEPGMRVAVIDGPSDFAERLDGGRVSLKLLGRFELIVCFATSRRALERRVPALLRARQPAGRIWLAWPKRASGVTTDLDDSVVRELGLATGLVDNKICAIDETWSGLRFVARRA